MPSFQACRFSVWSNQYQFIRTIGSDLEPTALMERLPPPPVNSAQFMGVLFHWILTMISSVCHRFWQCLENSRRGSERSRSSSRRGIKRRGSRTVTAALRSHTSFCIPPPIPGWQARVSQTAPQSDDINRAQPQHIFAQIRIPQVEISFFSGQSHLTSSNPANRGGNIMCRFVRRRPSSSIQHSSSMYMYKRVRIVERVCSHRRISCVI